MSWEMMGWGGFSFLFMLLWALVPVALIGLLVYLLVRSSGGSVASPRQSTAAEDPALRILRERFARGEIGEEEFRRMRAELEGRTQP